MTGLLEASPLDPTHILPAAQYPLRGLQSLILSTITVMELGDFTYPKVSLYTQLFYCTGHTRYSRWLYNQPWVKMNIDYLDKNINFVPYYKWTRHKICHHTKAVFALWCSPEGSCHMKCVKYRIHNTFLEASGSIGHKTLSVLYSWAACATYVTERPLKAFQIVIQSCLPFKNY